MTLKALIYPDPYSTILTESPAAARGLLDHDASADDVPKLGEEAEQGFVGHGVGDVENKQVASVRACSRRDETRRERNKREHERKQRQGVNALMNESSYQADHT